MTWQQFGRFTNTDFILETSSDTKSNISSSTDELCPVDETISNNVSLEDCSITFFAYKCNKKFNRHHCKNNLFTDKNFNEKRQLFLTNENYSSFYHDERLNAPIVLLKQKNKSCFRHFLKKLGFN